MTRIHVRTSLVLLLLLAGCAGDGPRESAVASEQPPAYDASASTATITGRVVFDGDAPAAAPVRIAHPFCRRFGDIKNEEVLVAPDGGLQNVIVYVRSGHEGRLYVPPAEPVVIDQQGCVYRPHLVTLMTGQELKVRNSEMTLHNVHSQSKANPSFNIGQPRDGLEYTQVFAKPELPVPIGCDLHPWMRAYVGVFEHPFHTVSADTGMYELRLFPGKYELAAWHEKYGEKTATIEVAGQETRELNFTFSANAPN